MPAKTKMMLGIAAGVFVGVVVLLIVIAASRGGSVPQGAGPGGGGAIPSPGSPGEDGAIPAEGADVFLAGGVATVPVPPGWRALTRADAQTGPGGHPEATILLHDGGMTLGVYVEGPDPNAAADVGGAAQTHAQNWTRDGEGVQIDGSQPGTVTGSVVGAATARYRYTLRGRALEGVVVHAARADGYTLFAFVDAAQGSLDSQSGVWAPLVDAVIATFASR